MTKKPTNIAASVQARLLNLARARKEDLQLVLLRYVNERLLYRLAQSQHHSTFVLKGASLFTLWTGSPHRATRDLDLGSAIEHSAAAIRDVFAEVLRTEVVDDGVEFDSKSLVVEPIREDQQYGGLRAVVTAHIAKARIKVQVDVGFDDAITPAPKEIDFPALLDLPAPVVAEKLDAMVQLGLVNSRMKDFYDLTLLAQQFEFDGATLAKAVRATFRRRRTPLPDDVPVALTDEFSSDRSKNTQWRAFLSKTRAPSEMTLLDAISTLSPFLVPIIDAARSHEAWNARWLPGGPWKRT